VKIQPIQDTDDDAKKNLNVSLATENTKELSQLDFTQNNLKITIRLIHKKIYSLQNEMYWLHTSVLTLFNLLKPSG
jgi:hypothetical protein